MVGPLRKTLLFGFLVWLVPFLVSFLVFPLKLSQPALFESVMSVVVTLCAVVFSLLYFDGTGNASLALGVVVGIAWLAVSIVLDLLFFVIGPIKMTLPDYMMDIGTTYLIIPTVAAGFGYLFGKYRIQVA